MSERDIQPLEGVPAGVEDEVRQIIQSHRAWVYWPDMEVFYFNSKQLRALARNITALVAARMKDAQLERERTQRGAEAEAEKIGHTLAADTVAHVARSLDVLREAALHLKQNAGVHGGVAHCCAWRADAALTELDKLASMIGQGGGVQRERAREEAVADVQAMRELMRTLPWDDWMPPRAEPEAAMGCPPAERAALAEEMEYGHLGKPFVPVREIPCTRRGE